MLHAKSLQLCLSLCDPVGCSPPGSFVHGILQARILEWVAIPFSTGSSQPMNQTCVSNISCIGKWVLYHQRHPGRPVTVGKWRNLSDATKVLTGPEKDGADGACHPSTRPTSLPSPPNEK